jgi:hypothetical protein
MQYFCYLQISQKTVLYYFCVFLSDFPDEKFVFVSWTYLYYKEYKRSTVCVVFVLPVEESESET